ncbi:MAG: integrase core domain-containing protein [Porticoccus sp.]
MKHQAFLSHNLGGGTLCWLESSQILLNNYYLPCELREHLQRFVSYYNHERYHESLNNLTPADVFYGRGEEILEQREMIKRNTLAMRKQIHYDKQLNQMS